MQAQEGVSDVKYWRTKGKAEIDFLVTFGNKVLPIEVKFKDIHNDSLTKSMVTFIKKYKPEKFIVVNKSFDGTRQFDNTIVKFVTYKALVNKHFVINELYEN